MVEVDIKCKKQKSFVAFLAQSFLRIIYKKGFVFRF